MNIRNSMVAAMAVTLAGAAYAGEPNQTPLTLFATQARLEIDAAGKVIDVKPDPSLSPVVAEAVRSTVAGWRFAAPLKDGKPVGGVTYVQVGACAADVDGGLRVAFDYHGNGPRRDGPVSPRPPSTMSQMRPGQSVKMQLAYRVGADGVAQVESIERVEGSPGIAKAFGVSIKNWIGASTFQPELVGGEPVATRMSLSMELKLLKPGRADSGSGLKGVEQAFAATRDGCQTALGHAKKQQRAVAVDSPFQLLSPG